MILNATLGGRYGTRGILAYTAHETDFHRLCSIGDSSFTRSLCPRLIPVVSAHVFETLLIGYLVLLAGNLIRGL